MCHFCTCFSPPSFSFFLHSCFRKYKSTCVYGNYSTSVSAAELFTLVHFPSRQQLQREKWIWLIRAQINHKSGWFSSLLVKTRWRVKLTNFTHILAGPQAMASPNTICAGLEAWWRRSGHVFSFRRTRSSDCSQLPLFLIKYKFLKPWIVFPVNLEFVITDTLLLQLIAHFLKRIPLSRR